MLDDQRLRWTLGLGATLGIASMAMVTLPAMFAAGLRYRPVLEWKHPAVRKLLVLSGWTIGFVAANQVAVVVIRNLATHEGEGILSAYVDAFTWFVLPHGLLAVSIATTFQPELARAVLHRDRPEFVRRLVARDAADHVADAAGSGGAVRAARSDHRADAARPVRSRGVGEHRTCPRRSGDRAGGVLDLPVHAARLLRPPRHAHAVRAQRRREPAQHRVRVPARRALGRARPRPRLLDRLPAVVGVGVAGDVVQGAARSRCDRWRSTSGARCWRWC